MKVGAGLIRIFALLLDMCLVLTSPLKLKKMIQTPTKRIVDAKWSIFYGKVVQVISPCYIVMNGQMQYNCICEDGSGGGMLPENILKPIEK